LVPAIKVCPANFFPKDLETPGQREEKQKIKGGLGSDFMGPSSQSVDFLYVPTMVANSFNQSRFAESTELDNPIPSPVYSRLPGLNHVFCPYFLAARSLLVFLNDWHIKFVVPVTCKI